MPGLTERWSPAAKRRSWRVADRLTWAATGWNENRFRRRIGLRPSRGPLPRRLVADRTPQIQAYDAEMVPGLAAEWDDRRPLVAGVDHASVLPRCVAAVHHGGAGTTAAGLRAGLPTLVCAVTADQPFWGERVRALGVGEALRLSTFTDEDALAGLKTVLADETRSAAAAFARRMTSPDKAVAAAADICEARLR